MALHHKAKEDQLLFIYTMGKKLRITAMFTNDDEANAHMAKSDDAVVCVFGPFIFLANKHDHGI